MKKDSIPGLSAALFVDRKPVWSKSYGYADRENKIPFTGNTVMNIASISKTFTGVCVMKAVEAGLVSLDADINTYLPFNVINPHHPEMIITLRNLATHTSSIIDQQPYVTTYHFGGDPEEALGAWLKSYLTPDGKHYNPINFMDVKPGTHYEYSNIGAGLAGYIVECVTGELLNTYSKRHIFEPLTMTNSGWLISEIDPALHAKLYYKEADSVLVIPQYGNVTYPDGGVRTSVSDLSKYFTCILQGGELNGVQILSEASAKTFITPSFTSSNKPGNIKISDENVGVFWSFENGRAGHSGSDPGVDTEMFYDLKKNIGVILFINLSSDDDKPEEELKSIPAISKKLWSTAEKIRQRQQTKQ
jgi:CubicO group peptidase (beta-lactamase class C family)